MIQSKVSDEPFDRLTNLCAVMTDALDEALEVEREQNRGSDTDLTDVRTIVFLEDDEGSGIVTHGYPDTKEAMASLIMHLKAIFETQGMTLDFIGMPDSPEGLTP